MTIIGKKADQCTAASIAFYSNMTAGNLSSGSFSSLKINKYPDDYWR